MPFAVSFACKLALKHAQEKTRKGIKIYSSMDEVPIINKEDLPKEFGGNVELQPIVGKKIIDFIFQNKTLWNII